MKKLLWLSAALVLLTACQRTPPTPTEAVARAELSPLQRFALDTRYAIGDLVFAANDEQLIGSFQMRVTLDRQGAVVECEAEPSTHVAQDAPAYNAGLARKMGDVCWGLIVPLPPEEVLDAESRVTVVAPLTFTSWSERQLRRQSMQARRLGRDHYLWHNLFAELPLDQIGRATFLIAPDAQGGEQACRVTLKAQRYRPDAFKADENLRRHLEAGCSRLSPQDMPYLIKQLPMREYSVTVEYAPWKKRLKQR